MNQRGFSLIELLIVIMLIGLLTGLGTWQYASYSKKATIQAQTRVLYGDLMQYRMRAFYEKRNWTFKFSASGYGIYSSSDVTVAPVASVALKHPVTTSDFSQTVIFDSQGGASVSGKAICVASSNDAPVDAVVISATRVQIGKKDEGSCASDNITAK